MLEIAPCATVDGVALITTVGVGAVTMTTADCEADPPLPLQVSVKLVFAVSGVVVVDPLVCCKPLHPPDAMQVCAAVAVHCRVVVVPLGTLALTAAKDIEGATAVPVAELDDVPAAFVMVDAPDTDCPQAANAANVPQMTATRAKLFRMRRELLVALARSGSTDREKSSGTTRALRLSNFIGSLSSTFRIEKPPQKKLPPRLAKREPHNPRLF